MEDTYVIRDLEQLKALSEPLRVRIVEEMQRGPRTTKQVAEALGEKPTRLYHHVDALERTGILRLVETRRNRGTLEKYFEPIAKLFIVDRELFATEHGSASEEAASVVQDATTDMILETLEEVREGIASKRFPLKDRSRVEVSRLTVRASPDRIEEIMADVHALLEESKLSEEEVAGTELLDYRLMVAFYPL